MGGDTVQRTYATFVGYKCDNWSIGGEYNRQENHLMKNGHYLEGFSFYGDLKFSKKLNGYLRFDYLATHKDPDSQLYMFGVEYNPVRGVKLSPNFRMRKFLNKEDALEYSIFLSCEFKI